MASVLSVSRLRQIVKNNFGAGSFIALGVTGFVVAAVLVTTTPAEARKRRGGGYAPPHAAMVIDAKTGRTLHAVNEDALRHPASITKVMTLYMLFEQIEKGRFSLQTPLRVSANAARQAPSKIGFSAGDNIVVEDAIKALITKSANDVAVVVAENISGTEEAFSEQMTRKARSLGMTRTTFRNASGLPDLRQVTTARDLITLGRALQEHFPLYYHYFGTRSFHYAGSTYRNHNKLLGRIEGVDGIKTGFTRMSGFNLLTSARDENRHVIGVVLGGRSGASRDRAMASLIEEQMPRAYAGARTIAPVVARASLERTRPAVISAIPTRNSDNAMDTTPANSSPLASASLARLAPLASRPQPLPEPRETALSDDTSPREPAPRPVQVASVASAASIVSAANAAPLPASTSTPSPFRWVTGAQAVVKTSALSGPLPPMPTAQAPQPHPTRIALAHKADVDVATTSSLIRAVEKPAPKAESTQTRTSSSRSNWLIQLGATDEEEKARAILSRAREQGRSVLKQAEGFTEKVNKDGTTLYRARFSGFDEPNEAQAACKSLKRNGFSCFATRG